MTADDLMRPGFVANTGFTAGYPLLDAISDLTGPSGFFTNIVLIIGFFLAWLITLFAFFFLAIQLFVTIIEFKLTTLAGFVLVPFALWNKTSFLAERVLGNVIASGVKLMVLAIIVGIGSTLFASVTASFTGDVGLEEAGAVILASLALFALGIFGPGIATGLVSGAPQLGAGAAVGAAAGVGAGAMAAGAVATGGAAAVAGGTMAATRAGASMAGGTRMAFSMGKAASGAGGIKGTAAGITAVAQAGAGSIANRAKSAAGGFTSPIKENFQSGGRGAVTATGGSIKGGMSAANDAAPPSAGQEPNWARQARRGQNRRDAGMATMHAVRSGDGGGAGQGPQLKQDEE
jgi:type IV secretion system protein TrbL